MEAWQKGAQAVKKMSKSGQASYFKKFPERQDWFKQNHPDMSHFDKSAKKASMGVNDKVKAAAREKLSLKAYGATKGTKVGEVGGEKPAGDKDTITPLSREQHSKVQAAKRASTGKALSKDERIAAISRAARKSQAKHDVPTEEPDDHGHDDMMDLHHSMHIGRGQYNEEVEQIDELTAGTLGSYIKKAARQGSDASLAARSELEVHAMTGKGNYDKINKNFRTAGKRTMGLEKATNKLVKKANEETEMADPIVESLQEMMNEKAPPGAKYERMVKHIKAGYSKDGKLSAKEKAIAYATAWKAKKANEEAELDEASNIDKLGKKYAKAEKGEAEKQDTYSKKYPGGNKQKEAAKAAFMKRFANEEVEQIDELKASTLHSYIDKRENQASDLIKYSHKIPLAKARDLKRNKLIDKMDVARSKLGYTHGIVKTAKVPATNEEVDLKARILARIRDK